MTNTSGRAAIYTRISDDPEGKAEGVARQETDCRALAGQMGVEVVEVFTDNDISASTSSKKSRPQFNAMLANARQGRFTHILAYSNSRLTRRPLELETLIDLHKQHGVKISTVVSGEDNLSTADGRMVARIKSNVDAAEAERTAERVKRAALGRAEAGIYHGGPPPFGYDNVKGSKTLTVNETEKAHILDAARRLLDLDETLYSIIKDWNTRGIATRSGNPWRHSSLRAALTNRSLLGETSAAVVGWEPILDDTTFERLRRKLIDSKRKGGNPYGVKSSKHTLAGGMTVCGRCGKPLTAISRAEKGNPPIVKMVCRAQAGVDDPAHPAGPVQIQKGREIQTSTGRVVIRADLLEQYVFEEVIARLNDSKRWKKRRTEKDPQADAKLALLSSREHALEERRDRAKEMRLDGDLSRDEYKRETDAIDTEIAKLSRERAELEGRPAMPAAFGNLDAVLATWKDRTSMERRVFLQAAQVARIRVNDYPDDLPTTTLIHKGETVKDYRARRDALAMEAVRRRVEIEWRDE